MVLARARDRVLDESLQKHVERLLASGHPRVDEADFDLVVECHLDPLDVLAGFPDLPAVDQQSQTKSGGLEILADACDVEALEAERKAVADKLKDVKRQLEAMSGSNEDAKR